jgi:hypothetical protein
VPMLNTCAPVLNVCPSTLVRYPLIELALPAMSGTPRRTWTSLKDGGTPCRILPCRQWEKVAYSATGGAIRLERRTL